MNKEFKGFHGEWNLGSPGGWEYQRMIQEIYAPAWEEFCSLTGIDVKLDIDNVLFKPSLTFADLLVEASKKNFPGKEPFIAIVAEEETLEDVVENKRFAQQLDSREVVSAKLAGPRELELEGEKIILDGKEVTTIFMDFNVSVLVELEKNHSIGPLLKAIERGILVNPRGMESINAKSIFEAVDERFSDQLSSTTLEHTAWTRVFGKRKTTGPNGEQIDDLVEWTRKNWNRIILKPELGWSGKGIIVCPGEKDVEGGIKKALEDKTYGNYIVQEFVPLPVWTEKIPQLDHENKKVLLKERQTDFRCLITNQGLIGFLGRYGGIPTNVGSGGGVQALAIIESEHDPGEAVKKINEAFLAMDFEDAKRIREGIDKRAKDLDFIYLNGPIPIALRPRMIHKDQIAPLKEYAENLYKDTLLLEQKWFDGELDDIIEPDERQKEIIGLQPRNADSPAMMASDGLFDFGACESSVEYPTGENNENKIL